MIVSEYDLKIIQLEKKYQAKIAELQDKSRGQVGTTEADALHSNIKKLQQENDQLKNKLTAFAVEKTMTYKVKAQEAEHYMKKYAEQK